MADGLTHTIEGLGALRKRLRAFQGNSARRILTRASRASMAETRKKARAAAKRVDDPETPEKIWKNVITVINSKHFKNRGYIVAKVGVRGGAKAGVVENKSLPGGDTFYWRYLEFGNSRERARPFLRPAFRPGQVQAAFATALEASIAKEIQKYGAPE